MSTPSDNHTELRALLQRLSDDSFSPEDAARLNDLLHGNPEACELYLDHLTLEAHLRRELGSPAPGLDALPAFARSSSVVAARANQGARRTRMFGAMVLRFAAAVVLGAVVALAGVYGLRSVHQPLANKTEDPDASPKLNGDSVATLLFADNCQWGKKERLVEGQRLSAGTLQLERGLVVVRFDGGAAVVLEGPTELQLETRGSARLVAGRLTVRAPEAAAGFTVHTPASDVVDLGTEFAIKVERNGATELHVLEGEISYSKPGTPQEDAELLSAGKAVRYDQARESAPRTVPLDATRFAELLSQAKIGPREDLLLAYEPFNYPPGRVALAGANGGSGWAGPWQVSPGRLPEGDTGDLTVAFGKLNIPWRVQGGRGPMLEAPPEYQSRRRLLAQPVRLDEDGVYYVSVLVRWETPPAPPAGQTGPMPAVRIVLRSSADFQGDHVMFNLPVFQRPQLDIRSGAIFTSSQTVARNETQFWVGKIVARRQGEDEIFFRVYGEGETLDTIEPADWSVRTRGIRSDAKLDLVLLTKFGGGTCWWDEVRIGKSWRAVVPTGAMPKPKAE
ncbi:MAG: FecR family protein [Gemmataceae bacterium]|nr:FecR family protein [Gemmataceae bacterium]